MTFFDHDDFIAVDIEEEYSIEDILYDRCVIYIHENISPKLNEKDIIENIKESKERTEEAKVTKNEEKINYDIIHENENKKEIKKAHQEKEVKIKEKFDEENKNDIENDKNKELVEKIRSN